MSEAQKQELRQESRYYGMPRNAKIEAKNEGWRHWAKGMAMLREIHREIAATLANKAEAEQKLDKVGVWD